MIADTVEQDSCLGNVSSSITGEDAEEDNNTQTNAPMEENIIENSESASSLSHTPTSENKISINMENLLLSQKNKKFRSKIMALHTSEKEQFKMSILQDLEAGTDYYKEILDKLENITDNKIYYHNVCRHEFRH